MQQTSTREAVVFRRLRVLPWGSDSALGKGSNSVFGKGTTSVVPQCLGIGGFQPLRCASHRIREARRESRPQALKRETPDSLVARLKSCPFQSLPS